MGATMDMILKPAQRTLGYAKKLAEGVTPQTAARFPHFGDKTIITNHPTFVFGHLSLYPARILGFYGLDASAVAAPAGWAELLKAGVECQDDPKGTIYPAWPVVFEQYVKSYESAIASLAAVNDSALMQPMPDEKVRETFPTLGIATVFMLNNHQMVHMGQVSAWRRCFGLPSAL